MKPINYKPLRATFMALSLIAAGYVVSAPLQPAIAQQARGLPDFTDLVDQVGPSVVNIRTLEKVSTRGGHGFSMDEDMQEFFKRFGIPMPNVPRQAPRQNRALLRFGWQTTVSRNVLTI